MKKIILNVRRHYGEVDWILPILFYLNKNYKIYTVFDSRHVFNNFKKNKSLYIIWKKINKDFYILEERNLILRVINRIIKSSFLRSLISEQIQRNISKRIFKIEDIFKKFKINDKNLKFFFVSIVSLNGFSSTIKKEILNCKIIRFPESTWLFPNRKLNKKTKVYNYKNQVSDFYLFSHSNDKNFFFKNDIDINQKSLLCGYPRYEKSWINKITKNNKKKNDKIFFKIVVATRKWEKDYLPFTEYKNSILDIMYFSETIKNSRVFFKLHPHSHEEEVIIKILNNSNYKNWEITNDHPMLLAKDANLCISMITSVTFDFLALNKPTIELYSSKNFTLNEKSKSAVHVVIYKNEKYNTIFKHYNLVQSAENYKDLIKISNKFFTNKELFNENFKSFKKLIIKKNIHVSKIIEELEKI